MTTTMELKNRQDFLFNSNCSPLFRKCLTLFVRVSEHPLGDSPVNNRKMPEKSEQFRYVFCCGLTASTSLNTRIRFLPANLAISSSDHLSDSSRAAKRCGYLDTSSSPLGTLKWKAEKADGERRKSRNRTIERP